MSTSLHTRLTPTEPDEWHQRVFPIDAQNISGGSDGTAEPPGLAPSHRELRGRLESRQAPFPRSAALASWELSWILPGRGPKTNVSQEFTVETWS